MNAEVIALRDARAWDLAIASLRASNATMLYVMFVKPALLEAFTVLAVAQGVSIAVYAVGRLREGDKVAHEARAIARA